jgi:hypothetical protein
MLLSCYPPQSPRTQAVFVCHPSRPKPRCRRRFGVPLKLVFSHVAGGVCWSSCKHQNLGSRQMPSRYRTGICLSSSSFMLMYVYISVVTDAFQPGARHWLLLSLVSMCSFININPVAILAQVIVVQSSRPEPGRSFYSRASIVPAAEQYGVPVPGEALET